MTALYSIAIHAFHFLIRMVAPFNVKARLYHTGRLNWKVNLMRRIDMNARYVWVHCASLGEFEQGRPVIEAIREQYPEFKILLTFFSPSGYEIRKKYPFADVISYLPADTRLNARSFLDITRPEAALFIKYEFWYHYLTELRRRSVPHYLVSGIFRKNQVFFSGMPWGKWFKKMLFSFTRLFVQDQESARLLEGLGVSHVTVAGDTRFDRVAAIAESAKDIPVVDKFIGTSAVLVAGSTWKPDEEVLARFVNANDSVKWIIAPHEVSPENVNKLEQMLEKPFIRFSLADESDIDKYQVLIIDSVGMLSSLYRYGQIAYVGGGFGVGIHNILEAATFGLPVIFGPNYQKFREARDLVALKAAFPVNGFQELDEAINRLLKDPDLLRQTSAVARHYVKSNRGATQILLHQIFQ